MSFADQIAARRNNPLAGLNKTEGPNAPKPAPELTGREAMLGMI